jgi:hypothetical protein
MISGIVILLFGSFSSIFFTNSLQCGLNLQSAGNFICCSIIIFFNSSLLDDRKGTYPSNRPYKMIPKLQTSMAGLDSVLPDNNSGDMYFKEPACTFSGLIPEVDPNIPKSTTLKSISNEFFLLLLPIYSS